MMNSPGVHNGQAYNLLSHLESRPLFWPWMGLQCFARGKVLFLSLELDSVVQSTLSAEQYTVHSGAEGILGEVVSPIQVSYLSKSVSTSRFRICRSLNISLGSE